MAVSVSKAGPYYSSGEISFSSLRSNFRAQVRKTSSGESEVFNSDSLSISASQLLRIVSTTNTSPVVPDATENANISTSINWKTSQFRNSIKYYYITLPNSDEVTNFDINTQNWNDNLAKNVNKIVFIDGTCGSNSAALNSVNLSTTAHNITIDVYGSILGASGKGGGSTGAPSVSGENGGTALYVGSESGNNISVLVRSGSKIYGGGGGGERGVNGTNGNGGTCYSEYTHQYCAGSPNSSCPSGGSYQGTRRPGCCRSTMRGGCVESVYQNSCVISYSTSGGLGGAGGHGGIGQGYNQTKTIGLAGSAGSSGGGCGATDGTSGQKGADGGDWASPGENTDNSGSGGAAGKAVSGLNYRISGSINSSTIKGSYNP